MCKNIDRMYINGKHFSYNKYSKYVAAIPSDVLLLPFAEVFY